MGRVIKIRLAALRFGNNCPSICRVGVTLVKTASQRNNPESILKPLVTDNVIFVAIFSR